MKRDWFIQYYFYDPTSKSKYPKGKQVRIKGMNSYHKYSERKQATEYLLKQLINALEIQNYNPITKSYQYNENGLDPYTCFSDGLQFAINKLNVIHTTILDYNSVLKYVTESINYLGYEHVAICNVTRKHIRTILQHQKDSRKLSDNRYNKYISYLNNLFNVLIEFEVIENNPVFRIKKKKITRGFVEVLTEKEKVLVANHLKKVNYPFYRYMMIFYYSGSRSTELFRLKVKDVDLEKQEFKLLIKKGSQQKFVKKPININALPFWTELLKDANENDFVFSGKLTPGPTMISPRQTTIRWRTWVKKPLGIKANFYALKHSYLDEVTATLSMQHAQKLAGHTTDVMLRKHYAINENQRQLERLKNLDSKFVKEDKEENKPKKVFKLRIV